MTQRRMASLLGVLVLSSGGCDGLGTPAPAPAEALASPAAGAAVPTPTAPADMPGAAPEATPAPRAASEGPASACPGPEGAPCCDAAACPAGALCLTAASELALCGLARAETFGRIVINEVLADGTVDGDPNQDGEPGDAVGDELVELVNASDTPVDLSGYVLRDRSQVLPRHTFAPGTVLAPGGCVVVFGGGSAPDDADGVRYRVANAADPGIPFGLSLDNKGDAIRLLDAAGALAAVFAWGPGTPYPALGDRSWTRVPDVTGSFVAHPDADGRAWSPGRRSDGSSLAGEVTP